MSYEHPYECGCSYGMRRLLWTSSLFLPKLHMTIHMSGFAHMIHRRWLCCLWLISVGAAHAPYDLPYDHHGLMLGRLLLYFLWNFTFLVIPVGLVPTQRICISPEIQTLVWRSIIFRMTKASIEQLFWTYPPWYKWQHSLIETKTKTYFSTLFAWVTSDGVLVFGRIARP